MSNDIRQQVREAWPFAGHCPECDHYNSHAIKCTLAPDEYRIELIRDLEEKLKWYADQCRDLARDSIMWEGKFRIVKHENNQLRRKLRKEQPPCD